MGRGRVFRRHWLIKVALPGLPWLIVITLISLAVLHLFPYFRYAPGLFIFALLPFFKLLQLHLAWLGYSVSVADGSSVLVERSGLLGGSERQIPLTQFASVECQRTWWASLFRINVGDAALAAMGGSLVLSSMGQFSDLWVILESKGQTILPKPPPVWTVSFALLWRCASGLAKAVPRSLSFLISWGQSAIKKTAKRANDWISWVTRRLRQPPRRPIPVAASDLADPCHSAPNGGYIYNGELFSPATPSQAGFWAFCEQFVLRDRDWTEWRYRVRNSKRLYYPGGISDHVARLYLHGLREVYVLIPVTNGRSKERLSCRIHSIEDIQRLTPDFPGPLSKAA